MCEVMTEGKRSRLFVYGTLEPKDHDLDEVSWSGTSRVGIYWNNKTCKHTHMLTCCNFMLHTIASREVLWRLEWGHVSTSRE